MQEKNKIIIASILILVIFGLATGFYFATNQKKSNSPSVNAPKDADITKATATVSITKTGFVPATIKVKKGTTITWTNTDKEAHQVSSEPYPTNDGLPGFDSEDPLMTDESYSFNFSKSGTFNYHDNLNPYKIKGTVVVE